MRVAATVSLRNHFAFIHIQIAIGGVSGNPEPQLPRGLGAVLIKDHAGAKARRCIPATLLAALLPIPLLYSTFSAEPERRIGFSSEFGSPKIARTRLGRSLFGTLGSISPTASAHLAESIVKRRILALLL